MRVFTWRREHLLAGVKYIEARSDVIEQGNRRIISGVQKSEAGERRRTAQHGAFVIATIWQVNGRETEPECWTQPGTDKAPEPNDIRRF